MKKIYMIMAAMSLLTLSLNAQVILEKNPNAGTTSQAMHKAPQRIDLPANQYLVGPYTTDDYDTEQGIGAISLGSWAGASIPVGVLLNPEDFQDYLGGNVVAFRAAFAQENDVVNYFIYQVKVDDDGTVTFGSRQMIPASPTADYSTHDPGWVVTNVADNSNTPIELKLDDGYNRLLIGYTYIQYNDNDYAYPIGKSNNNTGHPFYIYYQNNWVAQTSITYDMAMQLIVEMPEKTATPTITYTVNDDGTTVTINVEGDGELHMYVDGNEVPFPYTVGRGSQDYELVVTATAHEQGKLISDEAMRTITIPKATVEVTDEPDVTPTTHDLNVELNATGKGEVHMYVDGREVPSPWYLERLDEPYTVTVRVTAQEEGKAMNTHYETITVPARTASIDLTDWTELPGTFEANQVINWGNHIMFVDRFSVSTADDTHPAKYDYYLQEDRQNEPQKTNTVIVPVLKTGGAVNGYYTETDVQNDKNDRHMQLNLMNADFQLNLERNGDIYYYTMERSINTKVDNQYIALTKPQHNIDDSYTEMGEYYNQYENFEAGIKHRLDTIGSKYYYGEYNNGNVFMTYAPVVWSFGNLENNKRVNFDVDKKHNSYGSSLWQTSIGKVDLKTKQVEKQEDPKWGTTSWTEGTTNCSLYMIRELEADGYLPSREVSNIKYEPYMFRVFVESATGKLRGYKWAKNEQNDGMHCESTNQGPIDHPICIWEEMIDKTNSTENSNTNFNEATGIATFHKVKEDRPSSDVVWTIPEEMNIMFGAEDGIQQGDITIYVRFYYKSTGKSINEKQPAAPTLRADGDEEPAGDPEVPMYYAAEDGKNPSNQEIFTSINGVFTGSHGEIVGVTYVNAQGMQSDKPFDGLNIVITRYSDGTTTNTKVIR